jgi:transcriptional regulator with XRE-family HTH domain
MGASAATLVGMHWGTDPVTGPELRATRKRLGLTQVQLASLVGVLGSMTVSKWERGERKIPRSVEIILADAAKAKRGK